MKAPERKENRGFVGHKIRTYKYRRKVLTGEVETYLKELVQQIAEDKGFTVQLFECGECDHVHCFVTAPPKLSVTDIVKYLKGISGRKLFEKFPWLRQKLWKGGQYVKVEAPIDLMPVFEKVTE